MLKLLGIILALASVIAFAAARYINRRRLFDAPDVESDDVQTWHSEAVAFERLGVRLVSVELDVPRFEFLLDAQAEIDAMMSAGFTIESETENQPRTMTGTRLMMEQSDIAQRRAYEEWKEAARQRRESARRN